METKTKEKLKTVGKYALLTVVGAFAGIGLACLVAVGVRGCSAETPADQPSTSEMVREKRGWGSELRNAQETAWDSPERSEPLGATISPKRAPADLPRNNLLDESDYYPYATANSDPANNGNLTITSVPNRHDIVVCAVSLPRGYFYAEIVKSGDYRTGYALCAPTVLDIVEQTSMSGEDGVNATTNIGAPTVRWSRSVTGTHNFYFWNENEGDAFVCGGWGTQNVAIYLVDTMQVSEKARFDLPADWNPYQWLNGRPSSSNTGVFDWPLDSQDQNSTMGALTFRSNGRVYNTIWFVVRNMSNEYAHYVGYWDATGHLVYANVDLTADLYPYIIDEIHYKLKDPMTGNDVYSDLVAKVQSVPNANVGTDTRRPVYLLNEPRTWYSANYRHLDVIDYAESWTPNSNARSMSGLEWLTATFANEIRFDPSTWAYGTDGTGVFVLISNAVSSVTGFLSVEIFPAISIGLLLILPLVGGIIVLIIKAVSK